MLAAGPASASEALGDRNGHARLRPVVGEPRQARVGRDETLHDVAFEARVGFQALARLNPELDPWIPPEGARVRLPTRAILPQAPDEGLVVNLPEMRLYDFTHPYGVELLAVAIGEPTWPTPIGRYAVGVKQVDPVWHVPASIRRERPELPPRVPPGPENPLGGRWMSLGKSSYGLHGTNVRWSIGHEATHGCVRLYEDQMAALYERVPEGTTVRLVYQTVKWGAADGLILLEVHPDPYDRAGDPADAAIATARRLGILEYVEEARVREVASARRGVPEPVGDLPIP